MKYLSDFRNQEIVKNLSGRMREIAEKIGREVKFMEVCGTHAMSVLRFGIRQLIPPGVHLLSGPGCPVCVTPSGYIDVACRYVQENFLVATFGDMMKVPGSFSSLLKEKSSGGKVKVVYSPVDALKLASSFPQEKVVFLGIGFETTAPAVGASIVMAKEQKLSNFTVLCGHKLIPPAMRKLLESGEIRIDGFLCPGHVSVIIGEKPYYPLAEKYGVPCVIAGFEPLDILEGIYRLLCQVQKGEGKVENVYRRAVSASGNIKAQQLMREVFEVCDSEWRGLGIIKESGFKISSRYSFYDAQIRFPLKMDVFPEEKNNGCRCGEVLRGLIEPEECSLFARVCNPSNPLGPCMVSVEGACNIHYRFRGVESE